MAGWPIKTGDYLQCEAFRAFDRWVAEHDPDGNLDILDQALAYKEWSEKNSIEKYLDTTKGT